MKKRALVFTIILLTCFGLLFATSGELYLYPKLGTAGIPMNPSKGPSNFRYTPIKTVPGWPKGDEEVFLNERSLSYNLPKGKYTPNEMIATGGVRSGYSWHAAGTSIKVTATCDNGFYMVSQSNPSYKRPFELYIIPKARTITAGDHCYGKELPLGAGNNSAEIRYKDMASEAYVGNEVWFDVVLVLDGEMEAGDVLNYKGHDYPLTVADDYSAIVNITVQYLYNGAPQKTLTMTVPFTGFYAKEVLPKQDDSVSMFIHALPAASNIDMKYYGRQPVAQVRIQAVYDYLISEWGKGIPSQAYALFLSSSNDPYSKGDPFKLVKDGVVFPARTTPNNSIGFDVILKDKNAGIEVKYTGEQFVKSGLTVADTNREEYNFLISPEGSTVGGLFSGSHEIRKTKMFNYEGTAEVQIHDNSGILMEAGRYQSSIYVHVVELAQ